MIDRAVYVATLVAVAIIGGCTPVDDDGGKPAISVTVKPDGRRCSISEEEMACNQVAAYIHDVAKVASDKRIVVTGDPINTETRHFSDVAKSIEDAGYTFVIPTFYVPRPEANR